MISPLTCAVPFRMPNADLGAFFILCNYSRNYGNSMYFFLDLQAGGASAWILRWRSVRRVALSLLRTAMA